MDETTYNILKSDCERLKNEKVDGAITPNRLGDILCRMVESDKSDGNCIKSISQSPTTYKFNGVNYYKYTITFSNNTIGDFLIPKSDVTALFADGLSIVKDAQGNFVKVPMASATQDGLMSKSQVADLNTLKSNVENHGDRLTDIEDWSDNAAELIASNSSDINALQSEVTSKRVKIIESANLDNIVQHGEYYINNQIDASGTVIEDSSVYLFVKKSADWFVQTAYYKNGTVKTRVYNGSFTNWKEL